MTERAGAVGLPFRQLRCCRTACTETRPVVVGHRGAPAYRPEHTRESFELAVDLGADMIEPDLVVSRDGALVVRHENALSLLHRRGLAGRSSPTAAVRGRVEGDSALDWFVEDFDLAELRTLGAVERMPGLRPLNTAYDGRSGILTLADVVDIARDRSTAERPIRVLAELKQSERTSASWPRSSPTS